MNDEMDNEVSLEDYFKIVKKRKWLIILVTAVITATAVVFTFLQTPIYESSVTLFLREAKTSSQQMKIFGESVLPLSEIEIGTRVEILKSQSVMEEVALRLFPSKEEKPEALSEMAVSLRGGNLSVSRVGNTRLIKLTASFDDPEMAQRLVSTIAEVFIEKDTISRRKEVDAALDFLSQEIKKAKEKLQQSEEVLSEEISKFPEHDETKVYHLKRDRETNADIYTTLRKAKNELEIESAGKVSRVEIINPALRPTAPTKPNKKFNTLIGLMLGLITGTFFAFFREYSNKTIKTEGEIKQLLNLPILGVIPKPGARGRYRGPNKRKKRKEIKARALKESKTPVELITRDLPQSFISEAYRSLTSNLQFLEMDGEIKTIMVTSSIPQEGKTTVTINLAMALVSAEKRVLLVDVDLRIPGIHEIFKLDVAPGLTDLLMSDKSFKDMIHNVKGIDNLDILTSGSLPPNPSELLGSSQMKKLISTLKKEYDRILFDFPPALGTADVSILSSKVDGILLVVGANEVNRQIAQKAKESLEKAHILGVVFNKVEPGEQNYYYYRGR